MSLFMASVAVQAQSGTEVVLSQNTDEVFLNTGVSCPGGDNWYMRDYKLSEEGVTEDVMVVGIQFAVQNLSFAEELEVYAYDYAGFPGGFDILNPPTAIASATVEVGPADIGIKKTVYFDTPVQVSASSNVIVAVVQPFISGNQLFLAATAAETKTSYLAAENCGITEPAPVGDVGDFEDARHLINLVVDTTLSVNDVLAGNVSVYPNPSSDVFNVQLPSNVVVNSSSLVDVLGKTTGVVYSNGQMNVSALAPGVYFLNLDTNFGSYTQKVVKQ